MRILNWKNQCSNEKVITSLLYITPKKYACHGTILKLAVSMAKEGYNFRAVKRAKISTTILLNSIILYYVIWILFLIIPTYLDNHCSTQKKKTKKYHQPLFPMCDSIKINARQEPRIQHEHFVSIQISNVWILAQKNVQRPPSKQGKISSKQDKISSKHVPNLHKMQRTGDIVKTDVEKMTSGKVYNCLYWADFGFTRGGTF